MPSNFNLSRARRPERPIDTIRKVCPDIRLSDLGLTSEELGLLANSLKSKPEVKEAVHGRGDNWTEVGPSFNPYQTSPLVNPAPEFGGRWRNNFPGGGDHHINDDKDKQKHLKGNAVNEDFDPVLKRQKINDMLREKGLDNKCDIYLVFLELFDDECPCKELAKTVFGDDGDSDGSDVFMVAKDFDFALRIEREQREKGRRVRVETHKSDTS